MKNQNFERTTRRGPSVGKPAKNSVLRRRLFLPPFGVSERFGPGCRPRIICFHVNSFLFYSRAARRIPGAASRRSAGKQDTASRGNSITYARASARLARASADKYGNALADPMCLHRNVVVVVVVVLFPDSVPQTESRGAVFRVSSRPTVSRKKAATLFDYYTIMYNVTRGIQLRIIANFCPRPRVKRAPIPRTVYEPVIPQSRVRSRW